MDLVSIEKQSAKITDYKFPKHSILPDMSRCHFCACLIPTQAIRQQWECHCYSINNSLSNKKID